MEDYEKVDYNAFERLFNVHPELKSIRRGLPFPGRRSDGLDFFADAEIIDKAFIASNEMYSYESIIDKKLTLFNAGAGSPMQIKPYPPVTEALRDISDSSKLSQYQLAAGDEECRKKIVEELKAEGFNKNRELTVSNLIFTHSTTEAFDFLVKLLARPYDSVIFVGPTYGLFVYVPERNNAISRILPLSEEDDWLVNPRKLEKFIIENNKGLQELGVRMGLTYHPRTVAFVNINPSNPTGKVMSQNHVQLLREIYNVCENNGLWVIDDIIYRELVYDVKKRPVAMSTIEGVGNNVVTLLGPSKTFGLAGARTGMIIADETIIRGIRPIIFQHMDSTSLIAGRILQACYARENDNEVYEAYFGHLRSEYMKKCALICFLIEGETRLDKKLCDSFRNKIKDLHPNEMEQIITPIEDIKIAGHIYPESGFFIMLDFTASKGKRYKEVCIETERDVLYFYYVYAYVKLLMGRSIGWPRSEEFVARVSYALCDEEIILMIKQMKDAARLLEK